MRNMGLFLYNFLCRFFEVIMHLECLLGKDNKSHGFN